MFDFEEVLLRHKREIEKLLIKEGTHDLIDIYEALHRGTMQFFERGNTLLLTEILLFPKIKAINIMIGVGELEEVKKLIPIVEQFGLSHGCNKLQMIGRKGWARIFADAEVSNITLRRTL